MQGLLSSQLGDKELCNSYKPDLVEVAPLLLQVRTGCIVSVGSRQQQLLRFDVPSRIGGDVDVCIVRSVTMIFPPQEALLFSLIVGNERGQCNRTTFA